LRRPPDHVHGLTHSLIRLSRAYATARRNR